ncbi:hypothetical protein ABZ814_13430 [Micromonospora musae]|uniref:hypothetical protein n=1 Tax=Micromonospora musae TaxID=1894970 RepID=UPI0033C02856
MYQHLCVADHCGIPNRHGEHCPGGDCRGCLPRQAADGLYLCEVDTRRLAEDARTAAVLHEDLTLVLMPGGWARGERVASSSTGAPSVDAEVVEARSAIRATLVSLVRIIAAERGSHLPVDAIEALAAYVAHHAAWLAAHGAAGEHSRDLRDIAGDPRTRRLAYPSGNDRLYIGDCPLKVTDLDGVESVCVARLYAYGDQPLILCGGCGTEETVEWWQHRIVGEATRLVDAYAGAAELAMRHARPVDPALIRKWASLGKVQRHGQDVKGRTLYDVEELRRYAAQVWACVAA